MLKEEGSKRGETGGKARVLTKGSHSRDLGTNGSASEREGGLGEKRVGRVGAPI